MIELAKYADMKICVAVSGGKDSMALLHYLYTHKEKYGITLAALNCDHKIRKETSARDSKFVKEWCVAHDIPLVCFEWDDTGVKSEGKARLWRLKCYAAASNESTEYMGVKPASIHSSGKWKGAEAIATAHHLNDNAETVLFNLARGSALAGMEGITDYELPTEGNKKLKIIHPLISVSRSEIDGYIEENKIHFVEDESNFTDDYTRNKIRHNVLPELEKAVPGAANAIYRFSRLAADDEAYFDALIKERKLITKTPLGVELAHCEEKVIFKRAALKGLQALQSDIKDYTFEQFDRLYGLQFLQNGKRFEFLNIIAFKEEGKIALCAKAQSSVKGNQLPFYDFVNEISVFEEQFIAICEESELQSVSQRALKPIKILKFDRDKIPKGAVIRFMREGDKFTKFGGGSKSLGDYFTDKKIPPRLRGHIPLIADGREILAVCGVEISDKIKLTLQTQKTYYLICKDYTALI